MVTLQLMYDIENLLLLHVKHLEEYSSYNDELELFSWTRKALKLVRQEIAVMEKESA